MLSVKDKISKGIEFKQEGNEKFKAGEFKQALGCYHNAILYLKGLDNSGLKEMMGTFSNSASPSSSSEGEKTTTKIQNVEIGVLLIQIQSNMSGCYLKLGEPEKVLKSCDKILEKDPKHVKAHFRKGLAYKAMKNFDRALEWMKKANILEPLDSGIRNELEFLIENDKILEKQATAELKKNMANMLK